MRPRPVVGKATVPDAVRRLQDEFDYPDRESPEQLVPIVPALGGGGGGGTPTFVVAASDASDASKRRADYESTGVDDHLTIQIALDALPAVGGQVNLTEGTFNVDEDQIAVPANSSLVGLWRSTTLASQAGTASGPVVKSAGNRTLVQDLEINPLSAGASSDGYLMAHTNCRAHNVSVLTAGRYGLHVTGSRARIFGCGFDDCVGGMIYVTGDQANISGCMGPDDTTSVFGVKLDGAEDAVLASSIFDAGAGPALILDGALNAAITGSDFRAVDHRGIDILGTSIGCVLSGINIRGAGEHGISIVDSNDIKLDGITIYEPGNDTTNTYDGVFLANSDRCAIVGVTVIPDSVVKPRYGFNISTATCDQTKYVGNQALPAADFGTGQLNDAGTLTQYEDSTPLATNFTPDIVASGTAFSMGNAQAFGNYMLFGDLVYVTARIVMGGTTTFGTGTYSTTLPVAADTSSGELRFHGVGVANDAGTKLWQSQCIISVDGTSMLFFYDDGLGGIPQIGTTAPFTWASGDIITYNLVYQRTAVT